MDSFQIEPDNVPNAILSLLINLSARVRAMEEVLIVSEEKAITHEHDKCIHFHKNEVVKKLYEEFASVDKLLNPDHTNDQQ